MRRFLTKRNGILLALVLVGIFMWQRNQAQKKAVAEVKTAMVTRRDIVGSITVAGKVTAQRMAVLNFPAPGKLGYVNVASGQTVQKWQALAGLERGDLDTAVTRAWYQYLAADAAAKKVEDDMKGKETTETFAEKNTRVAAQTTRDMAYDAWLSAQRARRNSNLVAPFDGVVTSVTATAVGDTVSVTDGVTVVDPASLYFETEVDESDMGKIREGMETEVELDAYEGVVLKGRVTQIGFETRLSSSGATVIPVKVLIAAPADKPLRLGLNGDATLILERRANVLTLPFEAVVDDKVTLPGKEAKKVDVQTGLESDDYVEITAGLNEGDLVVVK